MHIFKITETELISKYVFYVNNLYKYLSTIELYSPLDLKRGIFKGYFMQSSSICGFLTLFLTQNSEINAALLICITSCIYHFKKL